MDYIKKPYANISFADMAYMIPSIFKFSYNIIKKIRFYKGAIKNWLDYFLVKFKLKKKAYLRFYNGKTVEYSLELENKKFLHYEILDKIRVINSGVKIKKKKGKFFTTIKNSEFLIDTINDPGILEETFIKEQYKTLNVFNKTVVDIGASIGDSAIYFAKIKKAGRVIAFEPYPYAYRLAEKNIQLNGMGGKITLLNQAVGSEYSSIFIKEDFMSSSSSQLKEFDSGKKIKITTLEGIIKRFKIKDGVLKVDCEGCEYDILLNAKSSTLKKFSQIGMECHYGYKNIVKKLEEAGFDVAVTKPAFSYDFNAHTIFFVNLVFAKRR